jgi:hypothetical protein
MSRPFEARDAGQYLREQHVRGAIQDEADGSFGTMLKNEDDRLVKVWTHVIQVNVRTFPSRRGKVMRRGASCARPDESLPLASSS